MAPDDDDDKPTHKDEVLATRVPPEIAARARKRAAKEGRSLAEVIRSWLFGWADDEYPSPPKRGAERAPQRPSKRKKKSAGN